MKRVIDMHAAPMMILREMILATIAALQIELALVETCIQAGEEMPVRAKQRVSQVLIRSMEHIESAPVVRQVCTEDEIPF